jgi:hypothetical protein
MKSFLIFILLILSATIFAQQNTYTRIFSGSSYDEGIAAFRLPNKEIRLIGNTGSFGHGSTDIWLIALDSNGDFLWQKFYGTPEIEKAMDAIMTPQGDIFIVGTTTQYYSKSYQVYFLGLDSYGQIITANTYGGVDWEFGYGLCQTTDSTFAIVGETYSYGHGQSDIYVLKVNRQGDTLWTKTYGGSLEDRAKSIKLMPDSSLIIAGASKSYGNGTYDYYFLRINQIGDTLWSRILHHITDAEFMDVLVNPDTSLVFCGYQKDSADTYRDIALIKYNDQGSLLWNRCYLFHESSDAYASTIVSRPNGNIIFGGTSTYRPTADARVIESDSDGWFESSIFIGTNDADDYGYKMTQDLFHGEHYFMIGSTKGYGVSMSGLFFVRFDSNLYHDTTRIIDLPTAIPNKINSQQILLYPNPAQSQIYIQLSEYLGISDLRIYDLNGREVIHKSIIGGATIKIDIHSLSNGFYQIRITNGQSLLRSQFIKQSKF